MLVVDLRGGRREAAPERADDAQQADQNRRRGHQKEDNLLALHPINLLRQRVAQLADHLVRRRRTSVLTSLTSVSGGRLFRLLDNALNPRVVVDDEDHCGDGQRDQLEGDEGDADDSKCFCHGFCRVKRG